MKSQGRIVLFLICGILVSCASASITSWREEKTNFALHAYQGNLSAEAAGAAFDLFPRNNVVIFRGEALGIHFKNQNRSVSVLPADEFDNQVWAKTLQTVIRREHITGEAVVSKEVFALFLLTPPPYPIILEKAPGTYCQWFRVQLL